MTDYLFVYGTLKRGYRLHHYLKNSQFICEGFITGYKMYMVSWYPAVVKGDGTVYGEVYKVNSRIIQIIDEIEEEGFLYRRVIENVITKKGIIPCYLYLYNKSVKGCKVIPTGRF